MCGCSKRGDVIKQTFSQVRQGNFSGIRPALAYNARTLAADFRSGALKNAALAKLVRR
ncbi:hypothetical protein Ga0061061_11639 [Chelatococcus sambhunathii]|uniref:Transposase n=1 Tax=Chelatococcus sambhunathii TaxID=363953 RepID=A0ABP2A8N7_9HYPH|nr:hypothetical protein [Chelatococcus sambhunathii]CUA90896.1 hypothetical protein Ga0061061_11639 [Chelatococcus sambhunathii]